MSKLARKFLDILDDFTSIRDFLRDLGVWGPLVTVGLAIATWLWTASRSLSTPTRVVLAASVLVLGLVVLMVIRIWMQIRPAATSEDLARSHVSHLTFKIADVAGDDGIIYDKTFENCTIYGPAVLVSDRSVPYLSECEFDGVENALFWNVDGRSRVIGGIGLNGCIFRRCRFRNVGFAGTPNVERVEKGPRGKTVVSGTATSKP